MQKVGTRRSINLIDGPKSCASAIATTLERNLLSLYRQTTGSRLLFEQKTNEGIDFQVIEKLSWSKTNLRIQRLWVFYNCVSRQPKIMLAHTLIGYAFRINEKYW